MDEQVHAALVRYVGRYGWSFNLARRLINRYFGTEYTEKELKQLYRQIQPKGQSLLSGDKKPRPGIRGGR